MEEEKEKEVEMVCVTVFKLINRDLTSSVIDRYISAIDGEINVQGNIIGKRIELENKGGIISHQSIIAKIGSEITCVVVETGYVAKKYIENIKYDYYRDFLRDFNSKKSYYYK